MNIMLREKVVFFALIFFIQGCIFQSDEQIIRKEFDIPSSARTIFINSSPEKGGWFGREGLKIKAAFQFNDSDFTKYRNGAQKSGLWKSLPVPKDFLMKMGGIKSHKVQSLRVYKEIGESIPVEGSVYNPTEEQLYERFMRSLPLDATSGLYQCRTAGNDIMHMPKRICTSLDKDLIDFMFAVLDFDKKILKIKVSTGY